MSGVCGDGFADDRSVSADEVEHARGQPGVVADVDERVCDEGGRDLGGLEDDGAAGGERGEHLEHHLVQRVVPRGDGADDTDGFTHDEALPISRSSKSYSPARVA